MVTNTSSYQSTVVTFIQTSQWGLKAQSESFGAIDAKVGIIAALSAINITYILGIATFVDASSIQDIRLSRQLVIIFFFLLLVSASLITLYRCIMAIWVKPFSYGMSVSTLRELYEHGYSTDEVLDQISATHEQAFYTNKKTLETKKIHLEVSFWQLIISFILLIITNLLYILL